MTNKKTLNNDSRPILAVIDLGQLNAQGIDVSINYKNDSLVFHQTKVFTTTQDAIQQDTLYTAMLKYYEFFDAPNPKKSVINILDIIYGDISAQIVFNALNKAQRKVINNG